MSNIYLDACCLIYLVEGEPSWQATVQRRLRELDAASPCTFLTSDLSRIECRTKPVRDGLLDLLARYDAGFAASRLTTLTLSRQVVDRAADLRARYGLKTPDALQVASALVARADILLTGDAALARCREVTVEVLSA